jgi:hypothetical protein
MHGKSEKHSIIRVRRIGELGTLAVPSNRRTLQRNTKYFCVLYFFAAFVGCYLQLHIVYCANEINMFSLKESFTLTP